MNRSITLTVLTVATGIFGGMPRPSQAQVSAPATLQGGDPDAAWQQYRSLEKKGYEVILDMKRVYPKYMVKTDTTPNHIVSALDQINRDSVQGMVDVINGNPVNEGFGADGVKGAILFFSKKNTDGIGMTIDPAQLVHAPGMPSIKNDTPTH